MGYYWLHSAVDSFESAALCFWPNRGHRTGPSGASIRDPRKAIPLLPPWGVAALAMTVFVIGAIFVKRGGSLKSAA
jgi:hypothetical protein